MDAVVDRFVVGRQHEKAIKAGIASTLLIGATLPSGATVGFLAAYPNDLPNPSGARVSVTMTATAPAGTALLDRVFAMAFTDVFVVAGPSAGAQAELYDSGGTLVGTVPLAAGAGATVVGHRVAGLLQRRQHGVARRDVDLVARRPQADRRHQNTGMMSAISTSEISSPVMSTSGMAGNGMS